LFARAIKKPRLDLARLIGHLIWSSGAESAKFWVYSGFGTQKRPGSRAHSCVAARFILARAFFNATAQDHHNLARCQIIERPDSFDPAPANSEKQSCRSDPDLTAGFLARLAVPWIRRPILGLTGRESSAADLRMIRPASTKTDFIHQIADVVFAV